MWHYWRVVPELLNHSRSWFVKFVNFYFSLIKKANKAPEKAAHRGRDVSRELFLLWNSIQIPLKEKKLLSLQNNAVKVQGCFKKRRPEVLSDLVDRCQLWWHKRILAFVEKLSLCLGRDWLGYWWTISCCCGKRKPSVLREVRRHIACPRRSWKRRAIYCAFKRKRVGESFESVKSCKLVWLPSDLSLCVWTSWLRRFGWKKLPDHVLLHVSQEKGPSRPTEDRDDHWTLSNWPFAWSCPSVKLCHQVRVYKEPTMSVSSISVKI